MNWPSHDPELQVHDGYEWMYVLPGRMRLRLGEHDVAAGDVAEFDTRMPHCFANPGPGVSEALTLFGPRRSACTSRPDHNKAPERPRRHAPNPPTPAREETA